MSRAPSRSIARAVAVHKVLAEMASLPDELGLRTDSSFELLDKVLVATVLEDRLLRAMFIDFVRDGEEIIQVAASIDWQRKTFATQGADDDDMIDLDDEEDFEESLMRKLRVFRKNIVKLARRQNIESAEWSLILIDDGDKRARSNAI